jgi:hypothetical protein
MKVLCKIWICDSEIKQYCDEKNKSHLMANCEHNISILLKEDYKMMLKLMIQFSQLNPSDYFIYFKMLVLLKYQDIMNVSTLKQFYIQKVSLFLFILLMNLNLGESDLFEEAEAPNSLKIHG